MTTHPPAPVTAIILHGDVRRAKVWSPITEQSHSHGLGLVGEPILPYLGLRASDGYVLVLGSDLSQVRLNRVDYRAEPNKNGHYPFRCITWADVDAPDLAERLAEEGTK